MPDHFPMEENLQKVMSATGESALFVGMLVPDI